MKKCRVTLEEFEAKYLMEGSQVLLVCDVRSVIFSGKVFNKKSFVYKRI